MHLLNTGREMVKYLLYTNFVYSITLFKLMSAEFFCLIEVNDAVLFLFSKVFRCLFITISKTLYSISKIIICKKIPCVFVNLIALMFKLFLFIKKMMTLFSFSLNYFISAFFFFFSDYIYFFL